MELPEPVDPFGDSARLALLDALPEIVIVLDPSARIRWMNATGLRMLGYRLDDLLGTSVFDHLHPDDVAYMLSSWEKRTGNPDEPGLIVQGRTRDAEGNWRAFEIIGLSLLENPEVGAMIVTARDLMHQSALADSPARLRSLVDRTTDIVLLVDADGALVYANRRLTALLGHDSDRVVGSRWTSLIHTGDVDDAAAWFGELLAGGDGASSRVSVRFADPYGKGFAFDLHGTNQLADPLIGGLIVSARDIGELVEMQRALEARNEQLTHAATHDPLTGLVNRSAFVDAVDEAIAARRARAVTGDDSGDVVVLFCDLDGFKTVNDNHGHQIGDRVLEEIARRLQATVRAPDLLARYGGDEFTVLFADDLAAPAVAAFIARLTAAVTDPVLVEGITTNVGVSVGVSRASTAVADVDALLQDADAAMYERKRRATDRS